MLCTAPSPAASDQTSHNSNRPSETAAWAQSDPVREPYAAIACAARPTPLLSSVSLALDYEVHAPSHFCFVIEAAHMAGQQVLHENLSLVPEAQNVRHNVHSNGINRLLRFDAQPGPIRLTYEAQVLLAHHEAVHTDNTAMSLVTDLPDEALSYLSPTRYCESDVLQRAAVKLFGHLPMGLAQVQAVADWVHDNISYQVGSSTAMTSAAQVFTTRTGVCRDFAHLGIALCRALNIPARIAVGYVRFDSPPQDFHAVFEVWVGGRWLLVDPTRMAAADRLVRIAVGHDAKDVAFSTLFGPVQMRGMYLRVAQTELPVGLAEAPMPEQLAYLERKGLSDCAAVLDSTCADQSAVLLFKGSPA